MIISRNYLQNYFKTYHKSVKAMGNALFRSFVRNSSLTGEEFRPTYSGNHLFGPKNLAKHVKKRTAVQILGYFSASSSHVSHTSSLEKLM